MGVEIRYIESESGRVCYRIMSPEKRPVLFFIHGAGSDSRVFAPQMEFFAQKLCSIAIDLPAHGRSSWRGIPTIDDYCDAVIAVADREKADRMLIAGHSMGAGVAFELYNRARKRVQALVIISAGVRLPVSDIAFELLDKDFATFCEFVVKLSFSREYPADTKELFLKELRNQDSAVVRNDFAICNTFNHTHLLEAFDAPILILASIGDKMVPIDISREVAKAIQHSKIVEYKWDGHMPHIEHHETVSEDIDQFLFEWEIIPRHPK